VFVPPKAGRDEVVVEAALLVAPPVPPTPASACTMVAENDEQPAARNTQATRRTDVTLRWEIMDPSE
jgi:hypothetical protein